ncbi:unnamed protein product [Amoebophrya sp. A25]|nr:unnamed protein product [Amoebophrya sp. A25]|eukprot:GSA25T00019386001.1
MVRRSESRGRGRRGRRSPRRRSRSPRGENRGDSTRGGGGGDEDGSGGNRGGRRGGDRGDQDRDRGRDRRDRGGRDREDGGGEARLETGRRVPPTDMSEYRDDRDKAGWLTHFASGHRWQFHRETGLYLHVKSGIYYVQLEKKSGSFRKIINDDDPLIKKLHKIEKIKKELKTATFVSFDDHEAPPPPPEDCRDTAGSHVVKRSATTAGSSTSTTTAASPADPSSAQAAGKTQSDHQSTSKTGDSHSSTTAGQSASSSSSSSTAFGDTGNSRQEGTVLQWNEERGFGFILPIATSEKSQVQVFVHRRNIKGSTASRPVDLVEGQKVLYGVVDEDGKKTAIEVVMVDRNKKALPIHDEKLEDKRNRMHVTMESLQLRSSAESWPGKKLALQDRYVLDRPLDDTGMFFGIFDGHGGTQVAEQCQERLWKHLLSHYKQRNVLAASRDEKLISAHVAAFEQTDAEICEVSDRKNLQLVGSTGLTVVIHGNPKQNSGLRLVCANLGDSRAILCRDGRAIPLSEDHKPDRLDERARIERAGGAVMDVRGSLRVVCSSNPHGRTKAQRNQFQGLMMTRSFSSRIKWLTRLPKYASTRSHPRTTLL